jgi:hypothetical protein
LKFYIQTKESKIKSRRGFKLQNEDFAAFTDKVQFDVKLYPSLVNSNGRFFYDELVKIFSLPYKFRY